jgi:hypothetical protein
MTPGTLPGEEPELIGAVPAGRGPFAPRAPGHAGHVAGSPAALRCRVAACRSGDPAGPERRAGVTAYRPPPAFTRVQSWSKSRRSAPRSAMNSRGARRSGSSASSCSSRISAGRWVHAARFGER